jgi:hypothetical protein
MYSLDENAVYFLDISEGAKSVRKIVTGKNNSLYFLCIEEYTFSFYFIPTNLFIIQEMEEKRPGQICRQLISGLKFPAWILPAS